VARLVDRLSPVGSETVAFSAAAGRVLAEPLIADRDSPPVDVSAMDGYAVRLSDLSGCDPLTLPVAGEAHIGRAPPDLPQGCAVRIVTGAPVPAGTEAVIRREDIDERLQRITVPAGLNPRAGDNIRRHGENLRCHEVVVPAGVTITPAVAGAMAALGVREPGIRRRVRVGVIVTGDELLASGNAVPEPWQIRDSNGPALLAMIDSVPWLDLRPVVYAEDDLDRITTALSDRLAECDAVFLTGGVSMGDCDYVPAAVARAGAEIVFHRLPIRPGKPLLGAVGPGGQAVLGLPGNPVSVLVTARRFGTVALRRLAGLAQSDPPPPAVTIVNPDPHPTAEWRFRLVRFRGPGAAELTPTMGSGDFVSAARSDGFVEIPPGEAGAGPWPFYGW
jgi:molybdopterin molybdotransferase